MAFPTSSSTIFRTTVTKLFGLGMTFSLLQTRILDGGRESKGRGRSNYAVTASNSHPFAAWSVSRFMCSGEPACPARFRNVKCSTIPSGP